MDAEEEQAQPPNSEETATSGDAPQSSAGMAALKEHVAHNKAAFAMFCCRIVLIIAGLAYLLPIVFPARAAYSLALSCALLASALRLWQRLPPAQFSREFAASLLLEDASHYVLYSLIFLFAPPLALALVPVTLFATLHSASYLHQLLDLLGPGSAAAGRRLIALVESRTPAILRTVAATEIVLLPYSVVMLMIGRGSLLVPFVYYRFLTLRYASRRNPYSRAIFAELRQTLESWADGPRCPSLLASAVRRCVALVSAVAPPVPPPAQ